jgi:hypothetical protein
MSKKSKKKLKKQERISLKVSPKLGKSRTPLKKAATVAERNGQSAAKAKKGSWFISSVMDEATAMAR